MLPKGERLTGRSSTISSGGDMVKLLEDISSATEHRPPNRRPLVTLAVTGSALGVAAILGVILLLTGGDNDSTTATGIGGPDDSTAEVTMSTWVDGVSHACSETAATHPILSHGPEARTEPGHVNSADTATRDLAIAVRGVALPTNSEDNTTASDAVKLGDEADQAWYSVAALPSEEVTTEHLTSASDATSALLRRPGELPATACDALLWLDA